MSKDLLYPLRCFHGKLHETNEKRKIRSAYKKEFKKNPKTVFLIYTPEHGNLGDHAIAQAETDLLTRLGVHYIEISDRQLSKMKWTNLLDIFNGFPILIHGGGNLGTIWMNVENTLREIIQKNPKSNIYVLPNTIFYEDSIWGKNELVNSIRIYNHHKRLTVYAREESSYNFMSPIYRDVRLIPDMVLSLKKDDYCFERKGCLLCLRNDRENIRTAQDDVQIRRQAEILFGEQVADTDMIAQETVPVEQRENVLNEKFSQFAQAELVITDRLHGMIFCAITGTPCVVIDSKSPKVRGCYEWIKDLDYIRFADAPENIVEQFRQIPHASHCYDNTHLQHYYQILEKDILNIWR